MEIKHVCPELGSICPELGSLARCLCLLPASSLVMVQGLRGGGGNQCRQKQRRQNLAQTHRCGAGCVSACLCLLGDLSTLLIKTLPDRQAQTATGVFGLDFAYFSGKTAARD